VEEKNKYDRTVTKHDLCINSGILLCSRWGKWGDRGEGRAGTHTTSSEVTVRRRDIKIPLSARGRTQDNWPDLHE